MLIRAIFFSIILAISFAAHGEGRVIILGFDGVDPGIVESMMAAGELPQLSSLRDKGSYTKLGSSNPPQSPTAWSSFTTGKHPGNHGVFDFLRRIPQKYSVRVGFGSPTSAGLGADGALVKAPGFNSIRKGDSFWKVANEQGAKVKILAVPFSFPADELEDSCMLSGLGVPDLRGTTSTYFLMSDAFEKPGKVAGGVRLPLKFDGATATVNVEGLRHPKTRKFVSLPVSVTADRAAKSVEVTIPSKTVTLQEGEWSEWLEWSFEVTPKYTAHAVSRIHVLEAGETVRLYMTCLQFHPEKPYIPFTNPESYSKELRDRYGFYKTIGWVFDTNALKHDALTESLFLEDVRNTMQWRETLTLDEIDRGEFDLLVSAWTGTDRVSHLFWRYRDTEHPMYDAEGAAKFGTAVEDTYKRMDETVGKVVAKLKSDDLLFVMSDHGFHSFRRAFNINTWLVRNGYLAVKGKPNAATATNMKSFLRGYDWAKTQAYGLGLGSIFLNLSGREQSGIVPPKNADAVIQEIREKLLRVTDPKTGAKVFTEIYTRNDFKGTEIRDAPDLQLGFAEGYQADKKGVAGIAGPDLFSDNTDKWSGEHAASDIATTPGILFSNKAITKDAPHLVDLSATALKYLGKTVPDDFEGEPLL